MAKQISGENQSGGEIYKKWTELMKFLVTLINTKNQKT